MRADGTIPAWTDLGLYGHIAHPLVGLLLAILLYLLYRGNIFKFIKKVKIPLYDCILLLVLIIAVTIAEKGTLSFFHGEMAEELSETILYLEMCYIILQIGNYPKIKL